ncbi:hypothetical protein [Usitatibacter palustris]|uniref:Uncharacterized protein n=1 Tax=Usitatibacter palustris TaxID=2732487 RepID=A0A6M4H1W8_9PROT|nr:hypothetical protein [Usitatibacter palustris]QJR13506.1 hypothetical protein DSM104440_00290 [Usitatibacter palustris]
MADRDAAELCQRVAIRAILVMFGALAVGFIADKVGFQPLLYVVFVVTAGALIVALAALVVCIPFVLSLIGGDVLKLFGLKRKDEDE